MKLLILSDSHGYRKTLYNIIRDHPDADAIIFLGDGELDFKDAVIGCHLIPDKMILQVRGNCDRTSHEPETIIREFDGVRFLIVNNAKTTQSYSQLHEGTLLKQYQELINSWKIG